MTMGDSFATGVRASGVGVSDQEVPVRRHRTPELSMAQIARDTGFSEQTASVYVHRFEIPIPIPIPIRIPSPGPGPGLNLDIDRARLAERCEQGWTVSQIAAEVGRSRNTVSRWLAECGLSTRWRHNPTDRHHIDRDELVRLIEAGFSRRELRKHYGCAQRTIQRRLSRYGLRTARARQSAV